jgi:hypothetical protein
MLGAIIGDVIGSVHEGAGTKTKNFPLFTEWSTFTDDSVLTIAVADWILTGQELVDLLHAYTDAYPGRGYGGMFHRWARRHLREPYNSFGNGAAMRVSPVGFAFGTMEEVLAWSKRSAEVTHNHPEGIRGAQATAAAIHLARRVRDRKQIRHTIESEFGYDLSAQLDEIRSAYSFNETCHWTVPGAHGVCGINELRGRNTQCHFARWGRRHAGVYRGRRRRSLLRSATRAVGSAGHGNAGCAFACGARSVLQAFWPVITEHRRRAGREKTRVGYATPTVAGWSCST